MCVAVPSPVVELFEAGLPMARVRRGQQVVEVCAAWAPQVRVGDHVIVSNGFIVEVLDAQAAAASLEAFKEIGADLSFLSDQDEGR